MSSSHRHLELNREYPAKVLRSNLISRGGNDIVLVTFAILSTEPGKPQAPTGQTETFSILTTNDDSLRIGCSELKAAFPDLLDPNAAELDVLTEVLAGSLNGHPAVIRLEPQSNGAVDPQTGRAYYNVRINQGYGLMEKDALKAHLAKRLGLGAARVPKLEA